MAFPHPHPARLTTLLLCFAVLSCSVEFAQDSLAPAQSGAIARQSESPDSGIDSKSRPDLIPDAHGNLSQEQIRELFRVVADKDIENQKRRLNYTYIDRETENQLDGNGGAKSTKINTYEVMRISGIRVQRLIAKDDKPLDPRDAAKEEEKIQKIIDKRKDESDDDRRKREEREAKDREDSRKFVREVADAYDFKLVGTDRIAGRDTWVIDGEPRPSYEPRMKDAKVLPKFHGRVWIDKGDLQLSKLDIEAIDTVSIGWLLARVHKGTRLMLEQTRVNDEVWLPRHVTFKLDARVALFKGYNISGDEEYSDYKKFGTTSKIVDMGEVKEEK